MKIQYTDKKTFELQDNSEKKLGHVTYDSLISFKANAMIGSDNYEISPTGFFDVVIAVTKNGRDVAQMSMNWKGHVIISFQKGPDFVLKTAGIFSSKYVLENKDQQKLFLLNPDFNWKGFNYNYNISYDSKPQDVLLILLAAYSANYCMAAAS